MAEGSRPIARPYEGQRVNAVPEGFLQAYAQVGQNIQTAGKALGEGIGEAIAAYRESQKKSEQHTATFKGIAPRLGDALNEVDNKLAEFPPDVMAASEDPTIPAEASGDQGVIYRALKSAREDLVSGIAKFEDMSTAKKEQWLGSAASLIKFAEDSKEERLKTNAAAADAAYKAEDLLLKKRADARAAGAAQTKAIKDVTPTVLAGAYARAIEIGKSGSTAEQINAENRKRVAENAILKGKIDKSVDPEEKAALQAQLDANLKINDQETRNIQANAKLIQEQTALRAVKTRGDAENLLLILKEQRKALLGPVPDILERYESGASVTVDEATKNALPAPVRKELEYVQSDISALEKQLAPVKGKDGKVAPVDPKAAIQFIPPSATTRAQALVARRRAQENYVGISSQVNYAPSVQELEWIGDLVEYDGTTTDDGYRISIDPKTGRIEAKVDDNWVKFNAKNPLLRSPDEIAIASKRQNELNQIQFQQSARIFGSKLPNGEQRPRRWIYDSFGDMNHIYIRGEALVDDKKATEVHQMIADANEEMSALSGILRTIASKNTDGSIKYKVGADGKPATLNGQPIPEVTPMDKLAEPDKKALAIGVANFIRIRAKSLGVLSAQDWAYLDTLIPNLSSHFAANIQAGQSVGTLLPKIIDYFTAEYTRNTDAVVNNAIALSQTVRSKTLTALKAIPAQGTPTGRLEVTGGIAQQEDGSPITGDGLRRWYDIAMTAEIDELNEKSDIRSMHGMVKSKWLARKQSDATKEEFKTSLERYKAFLFSRGFKEEQWNQIVKDYFAF